MQEFGKIKDGNLTHILTYTVKLPRFTLLTHEEFKVKQKLHVTYYVKRVLSVKWWSVQLLNILSVIQKHDLNKS